MTTIEITERIPRKARTILNRMVANRTLTREGMDWLIAATDPFHDSEIRLEGYPDIGSSKSVVQCVTQTTNVATNQPVGSNWDCHIFLNPCTYPWNYASTTGALDPRFLRTNVLSAGAIIGAQGPAGTPYLYSGLNVVGVANGQDWNLSSTAAGLAPEISIQAAYSYGTYRLIACGFEVHNTTAEIYKQGSVTCYKSPCMALSSNLYATLAAQYNVNAKLGPLPPTTSATAALFPNSKTWAASEGVYQVCSLNEEQNAFGQPQAGSVAGLYTNTTLAQLSTGANYLMYLPMLTNLIGGAGNNSPQNFRFPFDISGCIFAGLSSQTTLQVTVKYYFERMPTFSDPALLVLATPTAPYDPVALEIYSRVLDQLPVGVPVGENPLGEWFADVLRAVAEWAPKVGNALSFLPGAALVGQGLGLGADALATFIDKPKNQSKVTVLPPSSNRGQAEYAIVPAKVARMPYSVQVNSPMGRVQNGVYRTTVTAEELKRRAAQSAMDRIKNQL